MRALNLLPKLIGFNPEIITLFATARGAQVAECAQKLKELFPQASMRVVAQNGSSANIAALIPCAEIIEAMPAGMFSLSKISGVYFGAIKRRGPGLVCIVYNNPRGEGYFALELLSMITGGMGRIGLFVPTPGAIQYPEMECSPSFTRLGLGRLMLHAANRLNGYAVFEFIIFVIVLAYFAVHFLYRLAVPAARDESAGPA